MNIFDVYNHTQEIDTEKPLSSSTLSVVRVFRRAGAVLQRRLWFGFCLSSDGGSLVLQPAFSDCLLFDLFSPLQDFRTAAVRLFPAHAGMNRDATWVTQSAYSHPTPHIYHTGRRDQDLPASPL